MTLSKSEQERVDALWQTKPAAAAKCANYDARLAAGHSIALIQLQYKYICNFHCSHCSISNFRQHPGRLDIPTVKRVFDEADAYGLAHVGISGGEPLTFKDLPELIEAIGPERFHIQLDTNGWLFNVDTAKRMKSLGVDKVQISIDGLDKRAHDDFRRKPGSHARCLRAIKAAKESGLQLQVATVVWRERARSQEFREFVDLMHKLKRLSLWSLPSRSVNMQAERMCYARLRTSSTYSKSFTVTAATTTPRRDTGGRLVVLRSSGHIHYGKR